MAEHNLDPQFRKDVLKAKAKYRKRRKFIIISVLSLVLVVTLVQTFFYIREKKQINAQLKEQSQQIEKLEKEAKVNEVVIDKLKDPQFITDLVRQEYGLSYGGELIFSLPQQENFLKNAIEAIMQGNIEKKEVSLERIISFNSANILISLHSAKQIFYFSMLKSYLYANMQSLSVQYRVKRKCFFLNAIYCCYLEND